MIKTISLRLSFFSLDVAAIRYSLRLIAAAALCACVHARAQDATPTPAPGDVLLHPSRITLSGHFEVPLGPTAAERAVRALGEQIDTKHADDAARFQLSPIWDLTVWRYLPADPAHTLNSPVASDDDLFLTPDYLKVSARQLDYQLKLSERASRELLY